MANKFTQSVLERQYKEAQEEKRNQRLAAARQATALEQEPVPEQPIVQVVAPDAGTRLNNKIILPVPTAEEPAQSAPKEQPAKTVAEAPKSEKTQSAVPAAPAPPKAIAQPTRTEVDISPAKTSKQTAEVAHTEQDTLNLDAYIVQEEERVAKNKTFYLDQAVIDAVKTAAKRRKITDSKLVNDILRKVLSL